MSGKEKRFRVEEDMLGRKEVPAAALYGVHTVRALENFPFPETAMSRFPELLGAMIRLKQAAARANSRLGQLPAPVARAVEEACRSLDGEGMREHFPVPVLQGGGGTSANMNVNEVIANLAGEILGEARGSYLLVHPLDHVNLGQSTNDVFPSAVRVALVGMISRLKPGADSLVDALREKAGQFAHVRKLGRTCLQDAVPMTLGQEFSGYACLADRVFRNLAGEIPALEEINLGATAVGTGLGRLPEFPGLAVRELNSLTGGNFRLASNLFDATQNCDCFLALSGRLKNAALALSSIASDLRLLSSGPEAGLGEIRLPAVQAGSSIMPGKINPVIPEMVNQVAYRVCGHDATVTMALERGELELNIMEPVMALSLMDSVGLLQRSTDVFRESCIRGVTADEETCARYASSRIAVYTLLSARLGYSVVCGLISRAASEKRDIRDLVVESGFLDREGLAECLGAALPETGRAGEG